MVTFQQQQQKKKKLCPLGEAHYMDHATQINSVMNQVFKFYLDPSLFICLTQSFFLVFLTSNYWTASIIHSFYWDFH